MSEQDKERIEKDAMRYATQWPVHINRVAHNSFVIGATAENERLNPVRQPSFYRSPSDDYEEGYRDAKKEMAEQLKQERNKAIDEVIELIPVALDSHMTLSEVIKALEYLKSS